MANNEDPMWKDYLENTSVLMGSSHKDAILQNEPSIASLHALLVPSKINEEYFWKRWKYWKDTNESPKLHPVVVRQTEEDGEVINVSVTNLSQQLPLPSVSSLNAPQTSPDWDSWE